VWIVIVTQLRLCDTIVAREKAFSNLDQENIHEKASNTGLQDKVLPVVHVVLDLTILAVFHFRLQSTQG
jgi:hypothetical protein